MEEEFYGYALDLHHCCISINEAKADRCQIALLQRNCVRLLLLKNDPEEALKLCNQILTMDSEDVHTIQLQAEARRKLTAHSA